MKIFLIRVATYSVLILFAKFSNCVISHLGDVNWPPWSGDLMPLAYFWWSAVRDRYYANNPSTIQALNENIDQAIREMAPETTTQATPAETAT